MYQNNPSPPAGLFGGFRSVVFLAGILWTVHHALPGISGSDVKIAAFGTFSQVLVPQSRELALVDSEGRKLDAKSVWKFTVRNEGSEPAERVAFELPFAGVYQVGVPKPLHGESPAAPEPASLAGFRNQIELEPLAPSKEVTLTVWTDKPLEPGMEKQTKISTPEGNASIEYPVQVTGFLAWVEEHKLLISVLVFIAALLFLF